MDANALFLTDLTFALIAACLAGWLATRLGLSPILGYLLAGIVIGPFTPGFVAQHATIEALAEIGLIFLLFSIGLSFSFEELFEARWPVIVGTLLGTAVVGAGFVAIAWALHLPHPLSLAAAGVVSSTAIGVSFLQHWSAGEGRLGRFVLAMLVVQDLSSVTLLVLVSTPVQDLTPVGIAIPLVKAVIFVAVALLLGGTVLRKFVSRLLERGATDAVFAGFAALALGAAWIGHAVGLSFDFGAFIAGTVISEAAGSRMVQSVVTPFRAVFVALFFVSIGTLFDPKVSITSWVPVLLLSGAAVAGRFIVWSAVTRIIGFRGIGVAFAGLAMVPLGEFNIVLANAAANVHRISVDERSILIAITILSIIAATAIAPIVRRFGNPVLGGAIGSVAADRRDPEVLVIGYGRVGRTAGNVLRALDIKFTTVDSEYATIQRARRDGVDAVLGDGADPAMLDRLIGPSTRAVLATASGAANGPITRRILSTNPNAFVIARASKFADIAALREAGASRVIIPETEGALLFAESLLRELGIGEHSARDALERERRDLERSMA